MSNLTATIPTWSFSQAVAVPDFAYDEAIKKRERLLRLLADRLLDGIWLTHCDNLRWLTGGQWETNGLNPSGLLITQQCDYLITDDLQDSSLLHSMRTAFHIEHRTYDRNKPAGARYLLSELTQGLRIGTDGTWAGLVPLNKEITKLRLTLTPTEQGRFRILCQESTDILQTVARQVMPEQTEKEIAGDIAQRCYAVGIRPEILLVSADNGIRQYRQPAPRDKPIERYAILVLGAMRGGLRTELTRMVSIDKLSRAIKNRYYEATYLNTICMMAAQPTRTLSDVSRIGLMACQTRVYSSGWRVHSQGKLLMALDPKMPTYTHYRLEAEQPISWTIGINGIWSHSTFLVFPDHTEELTTTNDWPVLEVSTETHTCYRPDILYL